jgi:beta-xylosidase
VTNERLLFATPLRQVNATTIENQQRDNAKEHSYALETDPRLAALCLHCTRLPLRGRPSSATAVDRCSRSHLALSDFYAHDPFVLADTDTKTYYVYTAIGARQSLDGHAGVIAYKSSDLKSWDGTYLVFSVPDGIWANSADGAWAPEVHGYRGKWYLFVISTTTTSFWTRPWRSKPSASALALFVFSNRNSP